MAFAATLIMKLLTRFPMISWFGLVVLIYVAGEMLYRGIFDPLSGVLAMMGGSS
jgi:predicted tellurium resistance membrane protein TerC